MDKVLVAGLILKSAYLVDFNILDKTFYDTNIYYFSFSDGQTSNKPDNFRTESGIVLIRKFGLMSTMQIVFTENFKIFVRKWVSGDNANWTNWIEL
mgnify:CR=1 FL=1